MKKYLLTLSLAAIGALGAMAQTPGGGIDSLMMQRLRDAHRPTASDRAIRNALNGTDLDKLALNAEAPAVDDNFSNRVPSRGITDQKSSGRCWLFTGLNVLRSQMMRQNDLGELYLSQAYNFFFDQLEKSNLFLQSIIDSADKPMDDRRVDFFFRYPLSDGGQFTGLSDNISKYGVVPASAMPETWTANHTSKVSRLISLKLREDGLELRGMKKKGAKPAAIQKRKEAMLGEVYQMLSRTIGTPPTTFTWTRKDSKGKVVDTRTYTPQSFYKEYAGNDLKNNYVMVMNDPTRPYWKLYEIDLDRHVYDGENWTYVNLPIETIKDMAIASIKDSTMMYFSCDVGKFLDRERGVLDPDNFDYESLLGVKFGMDKADRIRTYGSASSHAMTLVAVDLDKAGKPTKWLVENSWGKGPNDGHLIITDPWFDEYMFRLVVDKKYAPQQVLDVLKQKPTLLPAWDPLF